MSSNDFLNGLLWAEITDTKGADLARARDAAASNRELAESLAEENRALKKRVIGLDREVWSQLSVRASILDEIALMDAGLLKRRHYSQPGPVGKSQRDEIEKRSYRFSERRAAGMQTPTHPDTSIYRDPEYCKSIGLDFEQVRKVLGI